MATANKSDTSIKDNPSPIYENVRQMEKENHNLLQQINKIIRNQQHTNQQILNMEERLRFSATKMKHIELLVARIVQVTSITYTAEYLNKKEQNLNTQIRNKMIQIEVLLQGIANKINTDVSRELESGINLLRKLRLQKSFVEKTEQKEDRIKHLIQKLEKEINEFTV